MSESDTLQPRTDYTFSRVVKYTGEWFTISRVHIYTLHSPQGVVGVLEYGSRKSTVTIADRLITTTPVWKWFQPTRYVFEENDTYLGEIVKSGWMHKNPYFVDANGQLYNFRKISSIRGWRDVLWNWRDIWKRKTHSLVELEHPAGRILYKYPLRRRTKSFEGEIEVTGILQDIMCILVGIFCQELLWADEEDAT